MSNFLPDCTTDLFVATVDDKNGATTKATATSSSIAGAPVRSSAEHALVQALHERLQVRAQVEDALREMLVDVELAHALQEQAQARLRVGALQDTIRQQQYALDELQAVDQQRHHREAQLADQLVRELVALSRELEDLKAVEARHKELLMQHDEVVAKLLQTEDELAQEREEHNAAPPSSRAPRSPSGDDTAPQSPEPAPQTQAEPEATAPPAADSAANPSQLDETEADGPANDAEHSPETAPQEADPEGVEPPSEPKAAPEGPAPAAVVLLDEDDETEPQVPKLEDFDQTLLMHVFSFLDALDILNTAQVNISMYSRVDALFGLGGNADENGEDVTPATATPEASTAASSSVAIATASPPAAATTASAVPTPTRAVLESTPVRSPTVVKLPASVGSATPTPTHASGGGLAQPVLTAPAAPSTTAASPSRGTGGLSLFSSILQPRGPAKPAGGGAGAGGSVGASPASALIPPGVRAAGVAQSVFQSHRRSASADAGNTAAPMNAAMANSMASKLSDAELNAIILMTERLKQKESLAERLSKENDQLSAQLEGAEAVKDFLISKIRDLEASLSANDEHEAKVARQIASDQEVIAFLDSRVQELEKRLGEESASRESSEESHKLRRSQLEQKVAVLGDLLQFERERVKENEVEWRATKKVLVKEVRNLRMQLSALAAERDGYREQSERLRQAVMGSGGSGGGGAPFFAAAGSPSRQTVVPVRRQGSFS